MNMVHKILYAIAWPFFTLVHPSKAIGRERIPEGGALLCANHSRNSDPIFVMFAMTRKIPLRIMAKEEIKKWPLVGFLLDKMGLIWVKRGQSDIGAVKSALKALKHEEKLLIFPEGTRHETVGDGKTGAAMIAIRAKVPMVPVFLPAKKKWFRRTPVVFGEAYMPFTEDRRPNIEDYRRVTEDLMQRISKLEEQAK